MDLLTLAKNIARRVEAQATEAVWVFSYSACIRMPSHRRAFRRRVKASKS